MSAIALPGPGPADEGWAEHLRRLARMPWFTRGILVAIALTGVLAGIETYPAVRNDDALSQAMDWLQNAVLLVFVVEIAVKIGAFGRHPLRYFRAGWNAFDFAVVALCLLPLHAEYVVVLRLLRLLRVFTALPGLQILVNGLLRGIPSLGYVGLLLLLHFYIYAVIGTFMFGDNDPVRFGKLHTSMLTLFQVLTLEGWNDILATQYHGSEIGYDDSWKGLAEAGNRVSIARPVAAAAYFISFILIGTMIMLNLFTGVIIRSMEEAQVELVDIAHAHQAAAAPPQQAELRALSAQLQAIAARLATMEPPPDAPARIAPDLPA